MDIFNKFIKKKTELKPCYIIVWTEELEYILDENTSTYEELKKAIDIAKLLNHPKSSDIWNRIIPRIIINLKWYDRFNSWFNDCIDYYFINKKGILNNHGILDFIIDFFKSPCEFVIDELIDYSLDTNWKLRKFLNIINLNDISELYNIIYPDIQDNYILEDLAIKIIDDNNIYYFKLLYCLGLDISIRIKINIYQSKYSLVYLTWLYNYYVFNSDDLDISAGSGNLEALIWLHMNTNYKCTPKAFDLAFKNNHPNIIGWLKINYATSYKYLKN